MSRDGLAARLLATFRAELDELQREADAHLLALETSPADAERLRALFRIVHTLKGAARAAGVPAVERCCHALEPLLAEARDAGRPLTATETATLGAGVRALAAAADRLRAGAPPDALDLDAPAAAAPVTPDEIRSPPSAAPGAPPPAPADAPTTEPTVRVSAARLDELLGAVAQLHGVAAGVEASAGALRGLHDAAARLAAADGRRPADGAPRELAALARDAARLARDTDGAARELARVTNEMSAGVRALRLRPVADAVEVLPRLVHDLARETGKPVRLVVEGTELTADRAVLEHVREALLHLVRNAVDHGIEPPAERRARGKPAEATVRVTARLEGDRLLVMVADDGRGLDVAGVRARLAALGERPPADDRALARRLFEGGVSTRAGAASAISGRGVGLDAVREAMRRTRGGVDVAWTAGEGTTFTLDAPLTLVTLRALLVRLGPHVAAVPSAFVERLLRVRAGELRVVEGRPMALTAEGPAPVVPLARVLGPPMREDAMADAGASRPACLLRAGTRRLALTVDELLGEREVVVRPIVGRGRGAVPHVAGAALLPDGRVALVLDAPAVVSTGLGLAVPVPTAAAMPALPSDEAAPRDAARSTDGARRVLVADDSITTRTLVQSVLESAGYRVRTAVDGADAWRILQEEGADLVVSDVEMPRMDGFGLCAAVRASARLRDTPVVLVTALETPEHRARGLEAGADAYLGKSSFDQAGLLDTVRRLLGAPAPGAS